MKIGIYASGLGQSFQEESVEKYATRFLYELRYDHTGVQFNTKTEVVNFGENQESTVVSIIKEEGDTQEVIYKFYDFKYNDILIKRFSGHNILLKNIILFWLVIKKFPNLVLRLFKPGSYGHSRQTIYLFFLFLLIATAILFVLPVALGVVVNFLSTDAYTTLVKTVKQLLPFTSSWTIDRGLISKISEIFLSVTAMLIIVVPQAKVIITSLATEFVCANNYLEVGAQSQHIHGNLDQLIEYIAEKEQGSKIHYHCYSFGSLVVLDILFPFGTVPSKNVQRLSEAVITIGTPVEFVRAYYKGYYKDRDLSLDGKLSWINVFSVEDALATNFRKDDGKDAAEFGLTENGMKPVNLNYEITNVKKNGFINGLLLNGVKAHSIYWDSSPVGLSCTRIIYNELQKQQLL